MKIEEILKKHKEAIVKKWFQRVLATYPDETAKFIKKTKDPFDNPVGATISQGIAEIFEGLLRDKNFETPNEFLERTIKIRAIQDFTPSQAVAFVYDLKKIIREELKREIEAKGLYPDLLKFESRVDAFALSVFDIYVGCREKVYELRANEVKTRVSNFLKRANLLSDLSDKMPEGQEGEQ